MVLEVSEQETETSPGAARRTMSFDKGSINRPKLTRMPNATEEEEPHCSHSSNNSNHHHNHNNRGVGSNSNSDHLNVEDGITSDNDYVSATSSQAESVYLSLERPLKVTVSSKEGDRSSGGNYRKL
ncbi:hypothetical protein Ocin01_09229 [Orchesella cincta]|uniref:Uncharacterized protein n=1 Tax=Orchesella cincta TaxID=48709 RepID=A0A1D2MWZ7_ORCCI|nr:hypothetical protein Ocin01_09229 [Orchesella cincta]